MPITGRQVKYLNNVVEQDGVTGMSYADQFYALAEQVRPV